MRDVRLTVEMGVLSDLFVAERPDVPIDLGGPSADGRYPAVDVKGLDQVKLGALAQLIFDGAFEPDEEGSYGKTYLTYVEEMSEPALQEGEEGPWIFPIPERFTEALAELRDEELPALAETWSATEEFELDHLSADDALDYLRDLKAIASEAGAPKQLFLWMSL